MCRFWDLLNAIKEAPSWVPGEQNILQGYKQMDRLHDFWCHCWVSNIKNICWTWLWMLSAMLSFLFLITTVWRDLVLFQERKWCRARPTTLCVHTRECPGEILWHAAGWWRWRIHIVPSLWLLLPIHAPIISSSTLVEPDSPTAKTHSHWHAQRVSASFEINQHQSLQV